VITAVTLTLGGDHADDAGVLDPGPVPHPALYALGVQLIRHVPGRNHLPHWRQLLVIFIESYVRQFLGKVLGASLGKVAPADLRNGLFEAGTSYSVLIDAGEVLGGRHVESGLVSRDIALALGVVDEGVAGVVGLLVVVPVVAVEDLLSAEYLLHVLVIDSLLELFLVEFVDVDAYF